MKNVSDSFEHRIFRQSQKLVKKDRTDLGSYQEIYNDYKNLYSDYLTNLVINLLEYKGAPKTLNQQGLEWMLRQFGYANVVAISPDEIYTDAIGFNSPGFNVSLGSMIGGITPKQNKGLKAILDGKEPEIITRENYKNVKKPCYVTLSNKFSYYQGQACADSDLINRTASTLAEIKANILANLRMQKTPFIGFTRQGNLSAKEIYHQLSAGKPFIQVDSEVFGDDIKKALSVFPLSIPNLSSSLADAWSVAMNEFLTMTGIDNVPVDKKERLISAEGESNNQQIGTSLQIYISARQQQIDLLNEALGTNIKVGVNTGIVDKMQNLSVLPDSDTEGGEDNENSEA